MTNKKGRVFIVCEPSYKRRSSGEIQRPNLMPASEWGTPTLLLPFNQTLVDLDTAVSILEQKLETFNDEDYLVPIGDPVLMCAAASAAAFRNKGRVKLLKWDRKLEAYYPIQLTLTEINHV